MLRFVQDELDVLVATTIIENGLDIPRVNTIVINRADLYGLSQLYQLRGRVGRSDRRAYAYLLVPSDEVLSEVARKRLAAIREFSDLGTGFRVAALDLEIRGGGKPARRRAARACRRGRVRPVLPAAGAHGPGTARSEARGGDLDQHQPQPRHPDPGGLRPRFEPASAHVQADIFGAPTRPNWTGCARNWSTASGSTRNRSRTCSGTRACGWTAANCRSRASRGTATRSTSALSTNRR